MPMASSKSVKLVTESTGPDLLLEDSHVARALEDGRLHVEALAEVGSLTGGEQAGAALLADVDVAEDLLELVVRRLRADHGVLVERLALDYLLHTPDAVGEESVIDRGLDQGARRAGAHLTWLRANIVKPSRALS